MPTSYDTETTMARRVFHNPPPKGFVKGAPKEAVMAEFGRLLQRLMVEKNWNQSDLARAAAKFMPDKKFHRDNVSMYVRGQSLPGPVRLNALAKALGTDTQTLLPTRGVEHVEERNPPLDARWMGDGNVWLRVNQAVSQEAAMKVLAILGQADLAKNDGAK